MQASHTRGRRTRLALVFGFIASIGVVTTTHPNSAVADFDPDLWDPATPGNTNLLTEPFSGAAGTIPAGWTSTPVGGWRTFTSTLNSGGGGQIPAADGGFIAHDDSDNTSATLLSPVIDLSAATNAVLTFDLHSFVYSGAEGNGGLNTDKSYLQINVLDTGGAELATVFELGDTDLNGAAGWLDFDVLLTEFGGQSVRLQFNFVNGPNDRHDIALDNIEVAGVPDLPTQPLLPLSLVRFHLPISAADVTVGHTNLRSNRECGGSIGAQDTVTELTSITIGDTERDELGNPTSALILYDHVEDGFGPARRRTQVTTEVWGDADPSNGFPPGHPEDLLFPGEVIVLTTVSDPGKALQDDGAGGTEPAVLGANIVDFESTQQYDLNYDAGDRLTSPTGLVVTRVGWNDGTSTLLAGAVEVTDVAAGWGSDYTFPVGEGTTRDAFEYVGASIMARNNGTVVTLPDGSTATIDAGESYFVDGGIAEGDTVTSSGGSISVNVIAGELCTGFEGRWFRLTPDRLVDNEYYSPVYGGNADVFMFNPNASAIAIDVYDRNGFRTTVNVAPGQTESISTNLINSGYRFVSQGGEPFMALQTYDTDSTTRDWGFGLLGIDQLSPIIQAGLAIGVDPTSGNTTDINSPIWVTSIWNGAGTAPGSVQICVDWNGNGGPNTIGGDPATGYDTTVSTSELRSVVLDETEGPPSNDLTGTKMFVCNPANPDDPNVSFWFLTGAWGQDNTGPGGSPSLDAGTAILNLPSFSMTKELTNIEDDNGNGITDVGDTLEYTLTVRNESGIAIRQNSLKIFDNFPPGLDYIENSTFIDPELNPVGGGSPELVPDDVGGTTAFPLDDADSSNITFEDGSNPANDTVDDGVWYNRQLAGGATIVVTFQAEILEIPPNNEVVNTGLVTDDRFLKIDSAAFFIPEFASIGDRVWLDEDGDGIQDAGEDGVAGVPVTLTYTVLDQGVPTVVIINTITDADGGYLFRDLPILPAGETYDIAIAAPPGMDATFEEDGSLNSTVSLVSDPFSLDAGNPLAIQPGEEHTTTDFGLNWVPPANTDGNTGVGAIGDRVWSDADGDGVQDPGEAGLAGVTVNLFTDPDGDGVYDTPAGTTVTDANGNYIFDDLAPAGYVVQVVPPGGLTQTGDPDAALDNQSDPIPLAPGDVYVNADFGYTGLTNTIGDTVWLDGNGDGVVDAAEPGFEGVSVVLLDSNGAVVATTLTDENGNYSFTGVPDGDYQVWVNDSANVLREMRQISDSDGTNDNRHDVSVSGGATVDTADFGYAPPDSDPNEGLIGDTVFIDFNGNGTADPGEGLEGVTVQLFDEFGRLVGTTITNENGQYAFGDLNPTTDGEYTVEVDTATLPAGLVNSVDPDGGARNESSLKLGPNEQNYDQDFGYVPANPASLSGTVWEDTDADGVLDPAEAARFDGVTIVVTETVTETFTVLDPDTLEPVEVTTTFERVVATTTTDANGDYSFDNLPPGDYTVRVTDDENIVGGYWHSDAPAPGTDGQSQDDEGYPVTLAAGATDTTADFGYYIEPGRVGNTVYDDANGNGLQDNGEVGIPGATVQLDVTYPGGVVVTLVTTTSDGTTDVDGDGIVDPAGSYSFGNLLLDEDYNGDLATAGGAEPTFVLSVTALPPGFEEHISTHPYGVDDGTDIGGDPAYDNESDDPAGTPAFPGQGLADPTNDFGFVIRAELGGIIYEDLDGNGDQDGADPGIPGAQVTVTPPAGVDIGTGPGNPVVLTTSDGTTDLDGDGTPEPAGSYFIDDLLPGDYTVEVTQLPDVYAQTEDPDAVVDNTTIVSLPAGGSERENDFGYIQPSLDIEKSTNGEDADDPTGPFIIVDGAVTWQYTVTNDGFLSVGPPAVTDDQGVAITPVLLPNGNNIGDGTNLGVLDPGETWVYEATGTAVAGQYENTAEATAAWTDSTGINQTVTSDEDQSHYYGLTAEIEIQKTVAAGAGAACPGGELVTGSSGDAVTYCFQVTNTGTTTLDDIQIDDADLGTAIGDLTFVSGTALQGDGTLDLAPAESTTFSLDSTIAGDLVNTANATGTPIDDITDPNNPTPFDPAVVPPPTDDDTAEVDETPTYTLEKTNDADGDGTFTDTEAAQTAVSTVPFQVTISNDGVDAATLASITDAVAGVNRAFADLACTLDSDGSVVATDGTGLIPGGDAATCTFSAQVDLTTATSEVDVISVVLVDDDDNQVPQDDDSTVTGEAAVTIDKTFVSATDADNDGVYDVTYTVAVANVGTSSTPYDLVDTPGFDTDLTINGGSATVVTDGANTPATPGGFTAPTWTLATAENIAPSETHTFTLVFEVDTATVLADPTQLDPCDPATPAAGEGLFNEATLTVAGTATPAEDCGDLLIPDVSVDKAFVSAADDDGDGVYSVTYTVAVANTGTAGGTYTLNDTPTFDSDLTIDSGAATVATDGANTPATPPAYAAAPWSLATDQAIDVNETHTYTLVFDVDATAVVADTSLYDPCNPAGPAAGEGLFNEAELNYSGQTEDDEDCGDLPLLTIDKMPPTISNDLDADGEVDLGDTLTYTIEVTNAGAVPLTGVTVVDTIITTLTCTRADTSAFDPAGDDLASGETITCTGDYVVLDADVTAGEVVNVATADSNETPPVDDTETVPIPPAVTIQKTVAAPTDQGNNQFEIVYTIVVGNTGAAGTYDLSDELQFGAGIVIDDVAVANTVPGTIVPNGAFDGQGDQVIIPVASPEAIAFNDSHTYTVTVLATVDPAVVDPADLVCPPPGTGQSGGFANTATVSMDNDTESDDACAAAPLLSIDKMPPTISNDLDADGEVDLGDTLTYTIEVTNDGGQPLTGVTVVDTIIATLTCTRADASPFDHVNGDDLAIGETITCTGDYVVVEADVNAGEVVNVATADSNETPPVDDTETVPIPPAVTIAKTVATPTEQGNDQFEIVYTIVVGNTGAAGTYDLSDELQYGANIVIDDVSVANTAPGTIVPNAAFDGQGDQVIIPVAAPEAIAFGEEHTYTVTVLATVDPAVVSPADLVCPPPGTGQSGGFANTATVSMDNDTESDDACAAAPLLSIDKMPPTISNDVDADGEVDLGDTLTYIIEVSNDGGQPLTGVTVVDTIIAALTCTRADASPFDNVGGDDLAVGETITCTGDYVVVTSDVTAAEVDNTAEADSNETPPVDDSEVVPIPPVLTIEKDAASLNSLGNGQYEIIYTITVGNVGADGTYDLSDELQYGAGIAIDSVAVVNNVPGTITPNAGFDGQGDQVIIPAASPEAIAFNATHVYTITVQATVDPTVVDPADLECPPPGTGDNGGFANTATASMDNDTGSDDACLQPEPVNVEVDKQVASGPTLEADGTYTIVYDVTVTNTTSGVGTYDLTDELQYGGGIVVNSAAIVNNTPGTISIVAGWDGEANTLAVDDGPITALETQTFTVTVNADALGLTSPAAGECDPNDPPAAGGFLNVTTVTAAGETDEADACEPVPDSDLSITKIVGAGSPTANADGTYTITYTIEVANAAEGPGVYDLVDNLTYGGDITVNSASITSADIPNDLSGWAGTGTVVTGVPLVGLGLHTYSVTVNATVTPQATTTARDCTLDQGENGTGFLNQADLVEGGQVTDEGDACVEAPPANIVITKTIPANGFTLNADGTYEIIYDVVVNNTGAGAGQYELDDEITFGDGITIDSAAVTATDPAGLATNAGWTGQGVNDITTGPVDLDGTDNAAGVQTHTYTITVTGDSSGLATPEAGDCTLDQGETGTGYLNTATITVEGVDASDDACDENPPPSVSVDKDLTSGPTLTAAGTYSIEYTVTVTNTGGFGTYDLSDTTQFGNGITLVAGTESVANTVPGDGSIEAGAGWVGDTWDGVANTTITAGQDIAAGGSHTFVISLEADIDPVVIDFATDAACPPPGTGQNGGFANTATVTANGIDDSDDACEPAPQPDVELTKTLTSGPTDLGNGTYEVVYNVIVTNNGDGPDAYDLDDELRFGPDIGVVSSAAVNLVPGDIAVSATWTGTGDIRLVTDEPIQAQDSHTYQITVVADALGVLTVDDAACQPGGSLVPGGLLNVATIDSFSEDATADDCGEVPLPDITLAKGVATGPMEQAGNPGVYDITYEIVVTNTGDGSGRYDLSDDLAYGAGITVLTAAITSPDVATDLTGWAGTGDVVLDEGIVAQGVHTYTVAVTAEVAPDTIITARDCTADQGEFGTGLLNVATLNGPLIDEQVEDACAPVPEPDISIAKTVTSGPTLVGDNQYDITYDIVVTNAGIGVGSYDLADDLQYGDGITVLSAAVASADVATDLTGWTGTGPITTAETIAGTTAHTFTVTVSAELAPGTLPTARDCTVDPGEAGTGLLNTATLSGPFVDPTEAPACEPLPDPDISIEKSVTSGPTLIAGTQYEMVYEVVVTNDGDAIGEYDLTDEIRFGGDITVDTATIESADVDVTGTAWDGLATIVVIDDVAIPATTGHTYTVTVTATVANGVTPEARDCVEGLGEDGTGFLNEATATVPGVPVPATDDACEEVPGPEMTVDKTVASGPTLNADLTYTVVYTVVATNTGDGAGTYDLVDTPDFGPAISINSATVESTDVTLPDPAIWDPVNDQFIIAGAIPVAGGDMHTYTLTFVTTIDAATIDDTIGDCSTAHTGAISEYFNQVDLFVDGTVTSTDDACVPPPGPNLEIVKTAAPDPLEPHSSGIYDVVYQIVVSNTGDGPTDYTLTDTFNFAAGVVIVGVEVSDSPPAVTLTPDFDGADQNVVADGLLNAGEVHTYEITVQVDVNNVTDETAFDCVLDPGEEGTGLLNIAQVNPEDDACIEIPEVADLSLIKSVSTATVTQGQNASFTLRVTNDGPANATGVTVVDQLPTGLAYVSHSGGEYVPSSGVWTIGDLPVGESRTLTIVARVDTTTTVNNVAEVETSDQFDPDSTPGNGVETEDDQDSATVRGTPPTTVPTGTTPPTGNNPQGFVKAAWLLIGAGVVLAGASRRRRRNPQPA